MGKVSMSTLLTYTYTAYTAQAWFWFHKADCYVEIPSGKRAVRRSSGFRMINPETLLTTICLLRKVFFWGRGARSKHS